MNSTENTHENFIIIGGCHVAGFGAEGKPSFVDIIESKLNLKCIFKKSNFRLEHIERLDFILDNYKSSLVFVQLGNIEFNGSLRMFSMFNNSMKSDVSTFKGNRRKSTISKENEFNEGHSWLYSLLLFVLKRILMPVIWAETKLKNEKYLFLLRDIVLRNSDKTFVILSPLPCYKTPSAIVRKKAISYYRFFFSLPNVVLINSFDQFPLAKDFFFNKRHLNAKGHELLGYFICENLLSSSFYK